MFQHLARRPAWTAAAVALLSAVALATAYWNVFHLVVLRDHPLPLVVFWPALWLLLAAAVALMIPSWRRTRPVVAAVFGGTGVVVVCGGTFRLVLAILFSSSAGHGELVDQATSADGRYEVRVLHWQAALGEDGWDVVIHRQDGVGYVETYGGCIYSESAGNYTGIESIEPGAVRLTTDDGPVSLLFDPETMKVTRRIPTELCAGYD
ncbi:hypothetical protein KOI35_10845 [Actinoplanes bogorensis]|uniref:Uncharacterized protein n=1 Tax=Paractinoplanes bogorensis TaxID=1610840 RepID=A0ABS5YKI9_9ACTN|nr:hypothetical protein [Actinoplanes bogorensis]MBU2663986.1 hypothetical protein [Actinoplanes bogorensis]